MENNQNNQNKYAGLDALKAFLDNIKTKFSELGHKHTISDLTDYTVDSELTSSSTNPVANKAVNDGINLLYETMFSITDEKADINHTHTKEDIGLGNVDNTADDEKYVYHAEIAEAANSVEWRNISNKPFSTTVNGTVILPITNVEESDDGNGIGRGSTGRFSAAVVNGEEYKVVFDGAEYYCTAYTDPIMNDYIILGNFAVIEPITGATNRVDTGEPFLICYSIIYKYAGVYTATIDSHTVEITHIEGVVESIDESCIPESIARIEDVPSIDGLATETFATNAASEKLEEAKTYINNIASGKADSDHDHDSDYSDINHNHDDVYAAINHNHDDKYDGKGVASSTVSAHNTSTAAHNDIRILIAELTTKLNNFLDVDDTTTDQLSELISLIQDNAEDIEEITSGKVNVSDIVNNLTTNVDNKPLSAAQGVAIKSLIDDLQIVVDGKADLVHTHPYGVCSSSATYITKTVTVENFSLVEGVRVIVKFTNANKASSPKLNVNGTGAIPIMCYGETAVGSNIETNGWEAGAILAFTYDGTNWVRDYWYNTTYTNAKLGQGYGTCSTATSTAEKEVSMTGYEDKTGGIVSIKFTYSVDAGATLNINGQGALDIYYNGSAIVDDVIKGGDIATFINSGSSYRLISVDRWHEDIVALQASESKVKQMETIANGNFPILLAPSDINGTDYRYTYYADGIYANPNIGKIYADISGNAGSASKLTDDSAEKTQLNYGGTQIVSTSGTGAAYTATIDGMAELKTGARITIIPHTNSTSTTATLDVNGLGAKQIRTRLSTNTTTTSVGYASNWIVSGKPLTLTYNGAYWVTDYARTDANTIYGTVPVKLGGIGKTTVTSGNFLVGNGTNALQEKTPSEVLSMINGASVAAMTTAEYNALSARDANTLYMLTDAEDDVFITLEDIDSICGATV